MCENLRGDDLKKVFKDCIKYALKMSKNEDIEIVFRFSSYDKYKFNPVKINYFCGFTFKDVHFFSWDRHISRPVAIDIIVHNIGYDCFHLIDTSVCHGNIQCQGHGDFWGTDVFTFTFYRDKE